jgi:radical SAM enzyme (TIGR01210 family)
VDHGRPYAYLVEPERTIEGRVEDVTTVFLSNRECPFHCLMCDLWKNTTTERVPDGAIATQVKWALSRLPPAKHVKLYNSGNFFDSQAIPRADWSLLAKVLRDCQSVVVETHPRLVNGDCLEFAGMLEGNLQVAMGLETVDPEVLPLLNKKMDLGQFERATDILIDAGIDVRAFILLRTPFQSEERGLEWTKRSIDFAFSIGVECCVVIPTRTGNGAMDWLQTNGHFSPPSLSNLEEALDYGVGLRRGRVFADLWDIEKFFDCPECGPERAERMRQVNLSQEMLARIGCGS